MLSIREVTQADFRLVLILVPAVILGIVLLLLRDVPLSLFMVGAILLSYAATLGLCHWIFPLLFGQQGMDWKVEIFLFVVMAAVGVDYNIFLAARLAQEARRYPARQAVARAVLHTGPVISSCGLIMAATLGSLMLGRVELLRQLGFALALGMLVDTFVVRPMLLPSFAALLGRTGRAGDWLA
jgi:RND superfamily putative drug exporter